MKKTMMALSVAAVASLGMFSVMPMANADSGGSDVKCKNNQTYNVKKGKCTKTTGATSYSPGHMHKHPMASQ